VPEPETLNYCKTSIFPVDCPFSSICLIKINEPHHFLRLIQFDIGLCNQDSTFLELNSLAQKAHSNLKVEKVSNSAWGIILYAY